MKERVIALAGLFSIGISLFLTAPKDKSAELSAFLPALPAQTAYAETTSISRPAQKIKATKAKTKTASRKALQAAVKAAPPAQVIIPSIGLHSKVLAVGVGKDGAMAVPDGKTKNVGWYKNGTIPGNVGNAVFDAHVFAAFEKLKNVRPGDDIYVLDGNNRKLHFVVEIAKTYALADLRPEMLFGTGNESARILNLITCAGNLTPDRSTYDHRLIVSATFVGLA